MKIRVINVWTNVTQHVWIISLDLNLWSYVIMKGLSILFTFHTYNQYHVNFFNKLLESFHRRKQFHFAVFWSNHCQCLSLEKETWNKLVEAKNNLLDMHLIQFLKNEFCFAYVFKVTSYFYKRLLLQNDSTSQHVIKKMCLYIQCVQKRRGESKCL